MSRQLLRSPLALLAASVLVVGLAPPPAAAATTPSLTRPVLAGFPGAGAADPADPAEAAAGPATAGDPAGVDPAYAGWVDSLDPDGDDPPGDDPPGDDPAADGPGPASSPPAVAPGTTASPSGVADEVSTAVAADGRAPVIVRLREQADLARVGQAAAQAGRQAAAAAARDARRVRGVAGTLRPGELAALTREAARTARGEVVVSSLRGVARESRDGVQALLDELAADDRAEDVRDFWIFNGFAATVDEAALAALAAHPDVASVTLDDTITLEEPIPAETGEPLLPSWSLDNVRAPDTWGEYGVRGADVVVGVMDTGVDGDHPALARSWRGNQGDPAASWFVPTGENYPEPGDGDGHGTHVTGSILGAPPGGEVTGVAPDAEWIAAKIFTDSRGTNDSVIHAGFEWMLAPGDDPANAPDVVNNSWGDPVGTNTEFWDDVAAWEAAGIVPVFSNGNSGPATGTVSAPASFPHAIGVGATDRRDRLVYFSSRGPARWDGVTHGKPDVSAPGYLIRSTWPTDLSDGPYHTISGTSMAAPHVTGVVALMRSAAPGLSVTEVRDALVGTARGGTQVAALPNGFGAGVVDAHAAVTRVAHRGLVTGTVTGPDGAPVAATVTAGEANARADAATGEYRLWLPAGRHELRIHGYGHEPQTGTATVTVGGTVRLDATLATAPEVALSGTVSGAAGPLVNARVAVVDTPVPAVRTDLAGRFRLPVAEGSYELRVSAAGHEPAVVPVTVAGDTEVDVTPDPLAGPAAPGWSQYQNNPARTGQSPDALVADTLQPAWTAETDGDLTFSSPVIADRTVFVNTRGGELVALDLDTGQRRWSFEGGRQMRGAPAAAGGLVFTGGGRDGGIHALDAATGELRWRHPTPDRVTEDTAPVVAGDTVYATTGPSRDRSDTLFALDAASGEERWSAELGPRAILGAAVGSGIVVAASNGDRRLRAFDADTGEPRWSLTPEPLEGEAPEGFVAAPSIADGTVYATTSTPSPAAFAPSFQGSLLALDAATGERRWVVPAHGDGQGTSPAVHGDLVIAGSHGHGTVGAYDRDTGAPVWHYGLPVSGAVSASVLVSADGYVVAGSQVDRRAFVLDAATGELVWEQQLTDNLTSSAAYAQGHLVVADGDLFGTLHAYHPSGTLAGTATGRDGPVAATATVVETGRTATADPQTGGFEIADHPPGEFTVEVSRFGLGTRSRTVEVFAGHTATVEVMLPALPAGAVTGTIQDTATEGLAGATVTLPETPLDPVVTGADGGYAFPEVPPGRYRIVATKLGYTTREAMLTVAAGATTSADFTLERFDVAVVSDFGEHLTTGLTDRGVPADRITFDELVGNTGLYRAVVLAGSTPDRADADLDRLAQIVAEADQTGTSLVFLGQWSLTHGTLRALSEATGDPAVFARGPISDRGPVWLEDVAPHPITASLPDEPRVSLSDNLPFAWFSGYSGYSLARLGTDRTGQVGDGIGYQPRTFGNNHVLLPVHAPAPSALPDKHGWTAAAWDLLLDSVDHAVTAEYGAVTGQVTDAAGDPVPATVELVGGVGRTVAGADGGYRLLLEPGAQTLRYRFPGTETVTRAVTVTAGETVRRDVSLPVASLGTLRGTVTDQDSGNPVAGATVTLPGAGLPAVTTGRDGRYLVAQIPGGSHRVEIAAEGYQPRVLEDVTVTEGEVTVRDVPLVRLPAVVVVGDINGRITNFLEVHGIPAQEAGWEVVDDLTEVEVVVLHDPPLRDQEEFLAALAAFDEAGVSVVFPAASTSGTDGVDMLVDHTGNPSDLERLGGFRGPEILLHQLADHPLFAGVEDDPVAVLTEDSEALAFPDYSGVTLAEVGEAGADPAGIGVAYDVRTPDSVHLLLTGLASTFRNDPAENWTEAGQQIFLNAMRWAAAPGLGTLTGTVTGPDGAPLTGATVAVAGTGWEATTGPDGGFEIGVPPGEHTLHYRAFGYVDDERTVTVAAGQTVDVSTRLALGEVGTVTGVVTSDPGDGGVDPGETAAPAQVAGPAQAVTTSLDGVQVRLRGTPRQTVTGPDGSYTLERVAPGSYQLELETDDHVRTLVDIEVAAAAATRQDVALRVSPLVGIIDDSDWSGNRDRGKEFLADWGYRVEEIEWDSLDRIPDLDLVVANKGNSGSDPGADGLRAFLEAVNRAGVSVLWMDQSGRGAIRYLRDYDGDPAVREQGANDGPVTATVVAEHPLVAGLPGEFPLIEPDSRYAYFDEFGGTTVATLSTEDGVQGGTIGYRGRTAGAVDVLLSTMSISLQGGPSTRQDPAHNWTPQAEQVLLNTLAWAVDAEGVGAEVRGTVESDRGGRIASTVEVAETGRTYPGRAGDGSFLVPLPPGTWTLQVRAFGHHSETVEVTVEAGESRVLPVTLAALPSGTVSGTVRGPDGNPIAGAEVTLRDTPLAGTAGADGGYAVDQVPEGEWTLRATADGFRAAEVPVSVVAGQTTPADVQLPPTAAVAFVDNTGSSTQGTALADLLVNEGYRVDLVDRDDLAEEVTGRIDDYRLVIFNSSLQISHLAAFAQAVDAAADAGVSTIFPGQFDGQALEDYADLRGDPEEVDWGSVPEGIDYVPSREHPIFAGFPAGEPIPLISDPDGVQQWASYAGWSGETVAHVHSRTDGEDLGAAVGFRFSTPTSVELLLGGLVAGVRGFPGDRWTGHAERIYLNAVAWTVDITQAELTGVVTGAGGPVPGARVEVTETGRSTLTGADGAYTLGLTGGTYTVEVSAFGFAPTRATVQVPEIGTVRQDFDLVPLPREDLTGTVRAPDGAPVPGAELAGTGPLEWQATAGADGGYRAADLLEGEYEIRVTAAGFRPGTVTVTVVAGQPAVRDVTLDPVGVGVLGDPFGALTGFLQDAGVSAGALPWDAELDLSRLDVVVVNGGRPDAETFRAVLAAADQAEVSLVFTGTWAVDRGGIRLLERYTDRVEVGAQGFGDGPVQLTGFDPGHPLFAGLGADPATLIVEGGYYSVLEEYAGAPLADLRVARAGDPPVAGLAAGWDWRTAGSVEVLLSASAVTEAVGPGFGWTPDGQRLLLNAVEWARDRRLPPPPAPGLEAAAPVVVAPTVTVSGTADWPAQVTVLRDGTPVVTVDTGLDGTWRAEVPLTVGDNVLTATASNLAGDSPESAPVTVARWVPQWRVRGNRPVHVVTLDLDGPFRRADPAEAAELVVRDADGDEVRRVELRWVVGFYLHVLRRLPAGEYTLSAELDVAGHRLVVQGPEIS